MATMKPAVLSALLILWSSAGLQGQEPLPRYFPLDVGNVWSFGGSPEDPARQEFIVLEREGEIALVRYQWFDLSFGYFSGPTDVRMRERGLEIDIELGEDGFVPFYRFDGAAFTHQDFRRCYRRLTCVAIPAEGLVETPQGTFEGCLHLWYPERTCSHGGPIDETFCPGIGLVHWFDGILTGWNLLDLAPADKPFLRGDANIDGAVNIADPLKTFGVLFLGEGFFDCADAADSNDDGQVNVSDGIFTLSYLFLGDRRPPDPGPEECGYDPTEDETTCATYVRPCLEKP
jgi:hypothetical protein